MHFKRALIVRLNGRATDGMHIYGTVLFPKGISSKGAEQKFDRVASALALPLTDAQANEYIAAAEAAVAHRSEAQKASHS
jgi:hypothetical protein